MISKIAVDIILPCYNPPFGWEQDVIKNVELLQKFSNTFSFRIIIVSDGSRRGYEPETIRALKQSVPDISIIDYQPNRGKGYALREAVKHGQSQYTIYTDYDFPYTEESFVSVLRSLTNGADVVVAVRDKNYQRSLPGFRKFLSISSHFCNTWILGLKIRDTQGGLKGFNRAGREIFLTTRVNSFLFDTEFIYKAQKQKANIQAVPASIREGIDISDMGLKVLRRELQNFFSILLNR